MVTNMKTLCFLLLLVSTFALGQEIKFTVTASDPVTNKRVKYTSRDIIFKNGLLTDFAGVISLHENDDSPAIPAANDSRSRKAVESYTDVYTLTGKFINSVTKLYVVGLTDGNGNAIPNAVSLESYFSLKAWNTFPSTGASDPLWKGLEGACKEMIAIRKANGEFIN